ncbi:MAG TPA: hypothetical protein VMW66_02505 [Elusimicrobiales bacterium]|nr:hypothetical protein [Elusimicrobiales bacterium]
MVAIVKGLVFLVWAFVTVSVGYLFYNVFYYDLPSKIRWSWIITGIVILTSATLIAYNILFSSKR